MILIVEDTESLRKLSRKILEKEGFSVDEAENGEIALQKVSGETKYSLILLDIMMPKMDGMEFIKNLRTFSEIPVVFITALSDELINTVVNISVVVSFNCARVIRCCSSPSQIGRAHV